MGTLPNTPVVLITGSSSGIGRATAYAFSRRGARLVLAARNQEALEAAAAECRSLGASAHPFVVNVADPESVEQLRASAIREYGAIDVWINCAAVLALGSFENITPAEFQKVIETNVLGYANGSRAALKQFRSQGDRGTLINVSSVLGTVPEPYVSAYVASKFAIRGLTGCIRQEVRRSSDIYVCTILPAAIDTPIYRKACNRFGRQARSILPVYTAARAARAIVRMAEHPRREVLVGEFAWAVHFAAKLAPGCSRPRSVDGDRHYSSASVHNGRSKVICSRAHRLTPYPAVGFRIGRGNFASKQIQSCNKTMRAPQMEEWRRKATTRTEERDCEGAAASGYLSRSTPKPSTLDRARSHQSSVIRPRVQDEAPFARHRFASVQRMAEVITRAQNSLGD